MIVTAKITTSTTCVPEYIKRATVFIHELAESVKISNTPKYKFLEVKFTVLHYTVDKFNGVPITGIKRLGSDLNYSHPHQELVMIMSKLTDNMFVTTNLSVGT